jgi:ferredoxin-NADP reductase
MSDTRISRFTGRTRELPHWVAAERPVAARVLYSARSLDDAIFRDELLGLAAHDEVDQDRALRTDRRLSHGRPRRRRDRRAARLHRRARHPRCASVAMVLARGTTRFSGYELAAPL